MAAAGIILDALFFQNVVVDEGYAGGFEAFRVKAASYRGWIVHPVSPCVLLGYVHVRMWVGNNVRI